VERPEPRRGAEQHDVHAAVEELLVAVEPVEAPLGVTSTLSARDLLPWKFLRLSWRRSMNTSHMATSLTLVSAWRASRTAPLPRPPHPTRPTRSTSLPAANAPGASRVVAAAVAAVVFRNVRRDAGS